MPRGYRHIVLAIGLIALPCSGQAQEEAQDEQGETATQQQPAQPLPLPFPVEIVEDDAEAEARKNREAEARRNEKDDLIAQQGMSEATQAMNRATERMAGYSRWSTIFVAIGTGLVFASLILMWGSNRAAVAAIKVTRKMGQRQIRAYVAVDGVGWDKVYTEPTKNLIGYSVTVKWKNCGTTPARRCHSRTSRATFDGVITSDFDYPDIAAADITATNHLGPGPKFQFYTASYLYI